MLDAGPTPAPTPSPSPVRTWLLEDSLCADILELLLNITSMTDTELVEEWDDLDFGAFAEVAFPGNGTNFTLRDCLAVAPTQAPSPTPVPTPSPTPGPKGHV